jgi:hypothetical protein
MKARFTLSEIELIKVELTRLLPDVKSSHRVEALARGLGWNTNAALRAELARDHMERIVDDHAFKDYLQDHGFREVDFGTLGEAVVRCKFASERVAIQAVMATEGRLTRYGFGIIGHAGQTHEQRVLEFQQKRREMLEPWAVGEFVMAREFLSRFERRKTVNKAAGSYWLKHQAENFHRENGYPGAYVSNGMLIAAAIDLGLRIAENGPNAFLSISLKPMHRGQREDRLELTAS